jgi:hypothetical protein
MVKELTEQLMAGDSFPSPISPSTHLTVDNPPLSSPLSLQSPPISENRKLEVPLSPRMSTRRVRFGSILATDNHRLLLPFPIDAPKDELPEESLLETLARADTQQLEHELAQEQLQEADSTMRVPVPVMDFSLPKPPWKITKKDIEALRNVGNWAGLAARKWHGVKSLHIALPWRPFDGELIAIGQETIGGDEVAKGFLPTEEECNGAEAEFLNTFTTLCIKEDKTGEFLNYGNFEKEQVEKPENVASPFVGQQKQKTKEGSTFDDIVRRKRKRTTNTKGASQPKKKNPVGDMFNSSISLDAFLNSRALPPIKILAAPSRVLATVQPKPAAERLPKAPQLVAVPFPVPEIPSSLPPADFIVSTTLLSQRPLFRTIKALYPAARLIERDFSVPLGNDSIFGLPKSCSDNDDADLLLSPTTGLLLTTLQRLRQRSSLPGEAATFNSGKGIKERIARVCKRYEQLLVLVSTSSKLSSSRSDLEVVAEFFGFAAALGTECNIVPRVIEGGDDEIATWIVSTMLPHRYHLLEDETVWEQFLRKARCNAFAAQALLKSCKDVGGLRGFLVMDPEERRRRFEGIVGNRVWSRVEGALKGWGETEIKIEDGTI